MAVASIRCLEPVGRTTEPSVHDPDMMRKMDISSLLPCPIGHSPSSLSSTEGPVRRDRSMDGAGGMTIAGYQLFYLDGPLSLCPHIFSPSHLFSFTDNLSAVPFDIDCCCTNLVSSDKSTIASVI